MVHGKAGFFIVQVHSAQTNKTYSLDYEQSLIFNVTEACSRRSDSSVSDPGEGPGGPAPPPLFLD